MEPEVVDSDAHLRPIERRIRRLVAAGVDPAEVAWRFRRSRRSVSQILALGSRPHREASSSTNPQVLRPLERRILAWREAGASYAEIGHAFAAVRNSSSRGGSGTGKASPGRDRRQVGRDLSQLVGRNSVAAHSSQPEWQVPEGPYPSFRYPAQVARQRCH